MKDVPKIVLKRLSQGPPGPHPDLNLLTAFSEQNLFGDERRRVLEHLVSCSLCRQMVAPTPMMTPAVKSGAVRNRRLSFAWRWGFAAAAALILVAVFVFIRGARLQPGAGNDQLANSRPGNTAPPPGVTPAPNPAVPPSGSQTSPPSQPVTSTPSVPSSVPTPLPELDSDGRVKVTAAGRVLLSPGKGISWTEAKLPTDVRFRAAAEAGDSLWAGGDGGVVFHSSDGGANWQSIEVHTPDAVLLDDITRIAMIDENRIVIDTASGISWTSYDGGVSWRRG